MKLPIVDTSGECNVALPICTLTQTKLLAKLLKVNNHRAPACCARCVHHVLFHTFTSKLWTIWAFWCKVDYMTKCLQFCNIDWELWLQVALAWTIFSKLSVITEARWMQNGGNFKTGSNNRVVDFTNRPNYTMVIFEAIQGNLSQWGLGPAVCPSSEFTGFYLH